MCYKVRLKLAPESGRPISTRLGYCAMKVPTMRVRFFIPSACAPASCSDRGAPGTCGPGNENRRRQSISFFRRQVARRVARLQEDRRRGPLDIQDGMLTLPPQGTAGTPGRARIISPRPSICSTDVGVEGRAGRHQRPEVLRARNSRRRDRPRISADRRRASSRCEDRPPSPDRGVLRRSGGGFAPAP